MSFPSTTNFRKLNEPSLSAAPSPRPLTSPSKLKLSTNPLNISAIPTTNTSPTPRTQILNTVSIFEKNLSSLVDSVSRLQTDPTYGEELTNDQEDIKDAIRYILESEKCDDEINTLEINEKELDNKMRHIISELGECRNMLSQLPTKKEPYEVKLNEDKNRIKTVSADDILKYAMKLAKFTTAPPTADSNTLSPANFVWPAEDALRKGMLAIASENQERLISQVLGISITAEVPTGAGDKKEEADKETKQSYEEFKGFHEQDARRVSTFTSNNVPAVGPKKIGGLDLFDSDDDEDDF